jgi:hypothetical protein
MAVSEEHQMHNQFEFVRYAQENFATVLMFAFGRDQIGAIINERFKNEPKYLNKIVYEFSEQRANRALLEMAMHLRTADDIEGLGFEELKLPPLGTIVRSDGSEKKLHFRQMTNKIIHAGGFSWELADPKDPRIVCLSREQENWKEAHIVLLRLMICMNGFIF